MVIETMNKIPYADIYPMALTSIFLTHLIKFPKEFMLHIHVLHDGFNDKVHVLDGFLDVDSGFDVT